MKKFRKIISKWQVVLPIVMVFLVVSCYPGEDELVKKDYTGEELFRGIFFLQGEVANDLESLRANLDQVRAIAKVNPESDKYFSEFADDLVEQVKKLDPNFLASFKSQVESDNYYAIELALTNSTKMLNAAGLASEKYSGMFRLMKDAKEKNIDFNEEFKDHDFSNPEDVENFKSTLKEKYEIDLDDEYYQVACIPAITICYAIAGVVSIAAVAYTALAGIQAVAAFAYWVYNEVKFWSVNSSMDDISGTNELVVELALKY